MNEIPLKFHQIWIGRDMPPAQKAIIDWNKHVLGAGWTCKLWRNKDLNKKNFPCTWEYIQRSKKLHGKKTPYAQISDLMRYEILYHNGGIYADASLQLSKSLTPMILLANKDKKQLIVCDQNTRKLRIEQGCKGDLECKDGGRYYVSNSFIGSVPRSDAMSRAVSAKFLNNIDFEDDHIAFQSGPTYLRSTFKKSKKIMIIRSELIYPYNWNSVPGSLEPYWDMYHFGKKGKSPDKCIFANKPTNSKSVKFLDQRKRTRYLKLDCNAYSRLWGRKLWDLSGSWHK